MRKTHMVALPALLLALLLAACAPQSTAPPPSPVTAPAAPTVPSASAPVAPAAAAKPAWQVEWDKTVEAAKKEGTVMIWCPQPGWRIPFTEQFGAKYGIKLEVMLMGKAAEQAARLFAERRAGLYTVDIHLAGASSALNLKPEGVYEPLDPVLLLPDVVDPKVWRGGELPFIVADHTILTFSQQVKTLVAINTSLVKPEEMTSFNDLLNPKWKGKIMLMDPTTAGAGTTLAVIADPFMGGFDYLRQLAKNEPLITRDKRTSVEWLARGKVAISVIPDTPVLIEFMGLGTPVRPVSLKEGAVTSSGAGGALTRVSKWPHPNAATLFINWLLGKEGQTTASKASGLASTRLDVPTDFINPILVPDSKVKYYSTDTEAHGLRQTEDVKKLKEIFGPLMAK